MDRQKQIMLGQAANLAVQSLKSQEISERDFKEGTKKFYKWLNELHDDVFLAEKIMKQKNCSKCNKNITDEIFNYSMKKYGKGLCFEHQE